MMMLLRNQFCRPNDLLLETKEGDHEVMRIESNPTQPKYTQPKPSQSILTESNQIECIPTQPNPNPKQTKSTQPNPSQLNPT